MKRSIVLWSKMHLDCLQQSLRSFSEISLRAFSPCNSEKTRLRSIFMSCAELGNCTGNDSGIGQTNGAWKDKGNLTNLLSNVQMKVFLWWLTKYGLTWCWRAYLTMHATGDTTHTRILRAGSQLFGIVVPDRFKGSIGLRVWKTYEKINATDC